MRPSETSIYEMIPQGCELSIRSWLEGFERQYACTLTAAVGKKNRWTGFACSDLKAALAAAMAAANTPPVDHFFWKGAKSSVLINASLWTLIILAAMAV